MLGDGGGGASEGSSGCGGYDGAGDGGVSEGNRSCGGYEGGGSCEGEAVAPTSSRLTITKTLSANHEKPREPRDRTVATLVSWSTASSTAALE